MGFRERPEYQDWRDAVFRLFGQKCIRCDHAGNIHAHHVMPVEDYPELAFEPTNGVPLCGNCHVAIKGNELAHAADLKQRQIDILGGNTTAVVKEVPSEAALRERAFAEPSNADAVLAWFKVADDRAVTQFYDQHPEHSTQTVALCGGVAFPLQAMHRWEDVIAIADKAMEISEREGTLETYVGPIASWRYAAMEEIGQRAEATRFLRQLVGRFPRLPDLHNFLSGSFFGVFERAAGPDGANKDAPEARDAIEECVRHALVAAELAPGEYDYAWRACSLLSQKGDNRAAIEYGKRACALALSGQQKILPLVLLSTVYVNSGLCADARNYLREALQIDESNVGVITMMADCFFIEGNWSEAVRMAKRGLMLDPGNEQCQRICSRCGGKGVISEKRRGSPGGCLVVIVGLVGAFGAAIGIAIVF